MKARLSKEDSFSKKKNNFLSLQRKPSTKLNFMEINPSIKEEIHNIINTFPNENKRKDDILPSINEKNKTNIIEEDKTFAKSQRYYPSINNFIKSQTLKNKKRIHKAFSNNSKGYYVIITFVFLFFHSFSYELKQRMIFYYSSNITIKLEGLGVLNIFYGGSSCDEGIFVRPNEVYINNDKQNDVKDKYDFDFPFNTIKLKWDNTITNFNCLFKDCINIIEIDFSEFSFSSNFYGYQMFYNCTSLTSLNLNPSITITIHNLVEMFSYCKSLTSINLSKFIIPSAMRNTSGMFRSCHSLTSLDLSSFSNSNLLYGQYMFYD